MPGLRTSLIVSAIAAVFVLAYVFLLHPASDTPPPPSLDTIAKALAGEGRDFGKSTDDEGCFSQAAQRIGRSTDIDVLVGGATFLASCFETATFAPTFCSNVPKQNSDDVTWTTTRCAALEMSAAGCVALTAQIQLYCSAKRVSGIAAAEPEAAPAPGSEKLRWTAHSPSNETTLIQRSLADGTCELTCVVASEGERWRLTGPCLSEAADYHFVANDCERWVALIAAPPRTQSWSTAVVGKVFTRGELDYAIQGIGVLPNESLIRASPTWLRGALGTSGTPPRFSADGASVEFDSIDGVSHAIPLVKTAPAPTIEAGKPTRTGPRSRRKRRQ